MYELSVRLAQSHLWERVRKHVERQLDKLSVQRHKKSALFVVGKISVVKLALGYKKDKMMNFFQAVISKFVMNF